MLCFPYLSQFVWELLKPASHTLFKSVLFRSAWTSSPLYLRGTNVLCTTGLIAYLHAGQECMQWGNNDLFKVHPATFIDHFLFSACVKGPLITTCLLIKSPATNYCWASLPKCTTAQSWRSTVFFFIQENKIRALFTVFAWLGNHPVMYMR